MQQRHRTNHTYVCQHESGPFSPSKRVAKCGELKHRPCHPLQCKCIGEPRLVVTVTLVFQWLKKQNWRSLEPWKKLSWKVSKSVAACGNWLTSNKALVDFFLYLLNLEWGCSGWQASDSINVTLAQLLACCNGMDTSQALWSGDLFASLQRKHKQPRLLGFTSIHIYSLGGLNELITEKRNADDDCHRHKVPDRRDRGMLLCVHLNCSAQFSGPCLMPILGR